MKSAWIVLQILNKKLLLLGVLYLYLIINIIYLYKKYNSNLSHTDFIYELNFPHIIIFTMVLFMSTYWTLEIIKDKLKNDINRIKEFSLDLPAKSNFILSSLKCILFILIFIYLALIMYVIYLFITIYYF